MKTIQNKFILETLRVRIFVEMKKQGFSVEDLQVAPVKQGEFKY